MAIKFQKAKPMQKYFKGSVYGPPGSGKTYTTLKQATGLAEHCGKQIAYIDTERGTDFYTEEFDFDAIYTKSLSDVIEAVEGLDLSEYGVVVVDSITHLWQGAIAAYEGKRTSNEASGGIPMYAWSGIKKPYKHLISLLMDLDCHVFILGRQKNVFEDDDKGNMKKVGVTMMCEGETPYEPHICCRMECRKSEKDSSKSTYVSIYEKDRTGKLAGRTFSNPSFKTIEPIMPLLNGESQAKSEDPDEVVTKDAEAMVREEDAKEKKSLEIAEACKALILGAKDMAALGEVEATIKPKKRYMMKLDTDDVRKTLKTKQAALLAA